SRQNRGGLPPRSRYPILDETVQKRISSGRTSQERHNGKERRMSNFLQGKVALVTGGSRGLGAATARSLADAGADVAITYTASAEKAAAVVKGLEDKGVQAAASQADQADAALAPQLIDDVVGRFGGLDILVNNAAIGVESGKTIDDPGIDTAERSEERRVGKEGRSRGSPYH